MQKLPIGVVGVGHLGSLHAKMLSGMTSVHFVGVMDNDQERAGKTAGQYRTKAFTSLADLLHSVRAITVATPTSSHFEIARQAVDNGVHLFIEKPITQTIGEAEELVRIGSEKNIRIQVGHIERFNPALLALEAYNLQPMFIESHRLAQFNPRGTDVAVVLDLMIHDIDIILSLVQSPVKNIEANGVAVVSDKVDIANARIQFENGCVANVTASRISRTKMRKMRLFQKDAYISIDFLDGTAEVFRIIDENDNKSKATLMLGQIQAGTQNRKIVYEKPKIKNVNALKYELESFVESVQNNTKTAVTAEEGLQALKVAVDIMDKISQQQI